MKWNRTDNVTFQENIVQEEIIIPHKLHNAIIGAKGRLIRSIMDECGGVSIKFPAGGSNSDKVALRGPKDDVEKAKSELLQLAKEKVNSLPYVNFERVEDEVKLILLFLIHVSDK